LPEGESKEVIVEIKNTSNKMLLAEVVPPNYQLSGIMVNPLVIPMAPGKQALVSIKYHANFRDLTAAALNNIHKPKPIDGGENASGMPAGLAPRNKKLAERLEKKKADASNNAAAAIDPKKKGGPPPAQPPPAKKEDPKAAAAKEIVVPKGKTREQVIAEMEAEEEKKRQEAEEAERLRLEEMEKGFDKHSELAKVGGKVFDFFTNDRNIKISHSICIYRDKEISALRMDDTRLLQADREG